MGTVHQFKRTFHTDLFDRISGFVSQPGGIEQAYVNTRDFHFSLDIVARGSGDVADDRAVMADEAVHQRRFARVGSSYDRNMETVLHDFKACCFGFEIKGFFCCFMQNAQLGFTRRKADVFVDKVELCVQVGEQVHQLRT